MSDLTEDYHKNQIRQRIIAITAAILTGALVMAAKFYIYRTTLSTAILADALESVINVAASAFALGSILLAAVPPDKNHPYGHGKIEYFSAGFEGALIILAAVLIFKTALPRIFESTHIHNLEEGLWLLIVTSVVNMILGLWLIRSGEKTRSLALVADGKHVITDVYTSAGVIVGLFMVNVTGWYWMDGVVACFVGVNILYTGGVLVQQSFKGLMNASEPKLLQEITDILNKNRRDIWIDVHQLRAWSSGNLVHIDFHLILPRNMLLEEAHKESKDLENLIIRQFKGEANVLIHMDPCIDADCPICANFICGKRSSSLEGRIAWSVESVTMKGWK